MRVSPSLRSLWVLLAVGLLYLPYAAAAPKADLWERWTAHAPGSGRHIDHGAWDAFLKAYVTSDDRGLNRVAYAEVSAADGQALQMYIRGLTSTAVSELARDEQLAYWINLYNALTVKVVLDHYPVDSILDIDISPGFFNPGPWQKKLVSIEAEELSLDDIEHRILRPVWRDPRIHYAVNCASVGCPNLRRQAFTEGNLDMLLDAAAREYINGDRGVSIDGDRVYVSSIYKWFEEDFGGDVAGVIRHLRQYATGDLSTALRGVTRLSDYYYNWDLNDSLLIRPAESRVSGAGRRAPK